MRRLPLGRQSRVRRPGGGGIFQAEGPSGTQEARAQEWFPTCPPSWALRARASPLPPPGPSRPCPWPSGFLVRSVDPCRMPRGPYFARTQVPWCEVASLYQGTRGPTGAVASVSRSTRCPPPGQTDAATCRGGGGGWRWRWLTVAAAGPPEPSETSRGHFIRGRDCCPRIGWCRGSAGLPHVPHPAVCWLPPTFSDGFET